MIVNIFKTLPWYFVGAAVLGVPSILLIGALFAPLNVESFISPDWVSIRFMDSAGILEDGQNISMATAEFYFMFAWLNINLLIVTIIFSLGWSIGSHFLNINEPGKAKFFGFYWLIVSGACVGGIILVCFIVLDFSSSFTASQDITGPSQTNLIILSTIYYGLMYWISVILGTARQARSAVLFANKLPARNFL
tara:strand:- start:855 stop:1433 length:579 start_codon:yes stop_codon:yes gene_type:complete